MLRDWELAMGHWALIISSSSPSSSTPHSPLPTPYSLLPTSLLHLNGHISSIIVGIASCPKMKLIIF